NVARHRRRREGNENLATPQGRRGMRNADLPRTRPLGAGREPRRAELSHATDDEKEERMRLVTFETNGRARLGVEWQDRILDLHDAYELARLWKGIPRDPGAASAREALWRS